jgi:hypothetical protein
MHNAVAVAQKFEQFVIHYGDDPFISRTISKMVSTRLMVLQKDLKRVQSSLARFEKAYGKTSDLFMMEFQSGLAGDAMDFIEWSALVHMSERLRAERAALQGN